MRGSVSHGSSWRRGAELCWVRVLRRSTRDRGVRSHVSSRLLCHAAEQERQCSAEQSEHGREHCSGANGARTVDETNKGATAHSTAHTAQRTSKLRSRGSSISGMRCCTTHLKAIHASQILPSGTLVSPVSLTDGWLRGDFAGPSLSAISLFFSFGLAPPTRCCLVSSLPPCSLRLMLVPPADCVCRSPHSGAAQIRAESEASLCSASD